MTKAASTRAQEYSWVTSRNSIGRNPATGKRNSTEPPRIGATAETSELDPPQTEPKQELPELAFRARQAGEYLADRLGLPEPFSRHQIWAMARTKQIPVVHLGRRMIFQREALDEFVASGGTTRTER